jgi:hypothetical protein
MTTCFASWPDRRRQATLSRLTKGGNPTLSVIDRLCEARRFEIVFHVRPRTGSTLRSRARRIGFCTDQPAVRPPLLLGRIRPHRRPGLSVRS